jgi:hypothetical protein
MPAMRFLQHGMMYGKGTIRHPAANQRQEQKRRELKSNNMSHE